jgi:hypothetical protein
VNDVSVPSDYRWVQFAGFVLAFTGVLRVFDALWAFGYNGAVKSLKHAILGDSMTTYGWLWLGVGVVLMGAGVAVLYLSDLGRTVGIACAAIGALAAMVWMPYYPVWSITYVALAVAVIYALTAHWSRVRPQLQLA